MPIVVPLASMCNPVHHRLIKRAISQLKAELLPRLREAARDA